MQSSGRGETRPGKAYEKVYKKHDSVGKDFLCHTPAKRAPSFVGSNEDVEGVLKRIAEMKSKASVRKGGNGALAPLAPTEATDALKIRHISVRGLFNCSAQKNACRVLRP